jgi:hypothetical protein
VNSKVDLKWETASEVNNDFFTIEKSLNGIDFENIGRIKGNGSTQLTSSYTFEDRRPSGGINYYRLSQTDFDGTSVDLGIRAIKVNSDRVFKLYPNPATNNQVFIDYSAEVSGSFAIQITNIAGKLMHSREIDTKSEGDSHMFDVSAFSSGIYIVHMVGEGFSYVEKLIID